MPPLMPMPMEGVQSEGCESWEYCSWHSTCLARGVSWLCRDLLGLKSEQEWRHSPTGKSSTNSAMYGARCHNPGISIVSASTCIYMCQKACVKSTCMGVFLHRQQMRFTYPDRTMDEFKVHQLHTPGCEDGRQTTMAAHPDVCATCSDCNRKYDSGKCAKHRPW